MARRLKIEWAPGRKVSGLLATPPQPRRTGVLLAHGAGAGQWSPFMVHLRDGLAAAGYPVLTFNYPYAEEGRRRPDPPKTTLACHAAAAGRFRTYCSSVVFAGKSMGGRLGSHVVADGETAAGLVHYGYPLVAPGKREVRSVDHLADIDLPQLFFVGTRDPLCPLDVLFPIVDSLPKAATSVIEGGDHSFKTPRDLGREWPDVLDDIVEITVEWLEKL